MATSFTFIDDLLQDYFHYRNLTSTARLFDNEISKLPFGQHRADQIIEQLTLDIHQFEINSLIDYWTQIEQRLLSTLTINPPQFLNVTTKIRHYLYKCYLIHAVQSSRTDKINEFFDRLFKILQQSNEWTKDWFALPFLPNPEENAIFRVYFTKQWNELFWISLQNFLSTAFFHMPPSKVGSIEENQSQPTLIKSFSPTSIRADSSLSKRDGRHKSTNETITSKLRSKFLPDTKKSQATTTQSRLPSITTAPPSIFVQPFQESTTGNQILLSPDESTTIT